MRSEKVWVFVRGGASLEYHQLLKCFHISIFVKVTNSRWDPGGNVRETSQKNFLLKINNETLEQGVKYVQS